MTDTYEQLYLMTSNHLNHQDEREISTTSVRKLCLSILTAIYGWEWYLWFGLPKGILREEGLTYIHMPEFADIASVPFINSIIQRRNGEKSGSVLMLLSSLFIGKERKSELISLI